MLLDTLKELCALPGASGREDAVRDYIISRVKPYAAELSVDAVGNLLVFVKGRREPTKKIMLAAHMDEVGVIITSIDDDGYLKFDFVGGVDRRVVIGKRVTIYGTKPLNGVIGLKSVHLMEDNEKQSIPKTTQMYIDIGCESAQEARELVSLGDVGCFDSSVTQFGEGFIRAKAIDDRVGCAIMTELIISGVPVDTWFAFTVQEEVGCRGANTAAYKIRPDVAIVLEGTTAADLPGQQGGERVCAPKMGPVIPFMDSGTIYDNALFHQLSTLAEQNNIPWQTKTKVSGGTDASAIMKVAGGVKVAGIAAPVRYIHSPSCVGYVEDFNNMEKLVKAYLETL